MSVIVDSSLNHFLDGTVEDILMTSVLINKKSKSIVIPVSSHQTAGRKAVLALLAVGGVAWHVVAAVVAVVVVGVVATAAGGWGDWSRCRCAGPRCSASAARSGGSLVGGGRGGSCR